MTSDLVTIRACWHTCVDRQLTCRLVKPPGYYIVLQQDGAARAEAALRKLKAMMPALPVEQRLLESSLWNNFASLLRDQPVRR